MRSLRLVALAAAALATFCTLYVIARRFRYPHELEWMIGGVLDHIERIRQGKPLYASPTLDWVPYLYPPAYYWLCSLVTGAGREFMACRGVSIAAMGVQAFCVYRLARRNGADTTWAALGVGVFFGAYSFSGFWYDLERSDSLFVALVLVATLALSEPHRLARVVFAGALLAVSYFVKQPALVFAGAGTCALVFLRRIPQAVAFALVALGPVALGTMWLDRTSDGWFSYYTLKMPAAHGISAYLGVLLALDLVKAVVLTAATAILVLTVAAAYRRREAATGIVVFAFMLLAALFASSASRLHEGGYANVLMFWSTYASIAVALVGARWSTDRSSIKQAAAYGLVIVQLALFAFSPARHIPTRAQAEAFERLDAETKALEAEGPVFVAEHGHVSAERHSHIYALFDLFTMEKRIRPEVAQPFVTRRFAAIVSDFPFDQLVRDRWPAEGADLPLPKQLNLLILASYYPSARLSFPERMSIVPEGFPTAPRWILRRRSEPLTGLSLADERKRVLAELTLASDTGPRDATGDSVEVRAKRLVDGSK